MVDSGAHEAMWKQEFQMLLPLVFNYLNLCLRSQSFKSTRCQFRLNKNALDFKQPIITKFEIIEFKKKKTIL